MADYRTPASGNFIASLLELSNYMKSNGNQIVFAFPVKDGGYSWAEWMKGYGNKVIYFDEKKEEEEIINSLDKIIKQYQINLIHSHFGYLHKVLVKYGKRLGIKVLFHDHMDYSLESGQGKQYFRQILKSLVYRLKGIGVISVMQKKSRVYFLCGKKLNWYIPNGISFKRNIEKSLTRDEVRSNLHLNDEDKLCLLLGYDILGKGVDVAIKAVQQLQKKDSTVILGIVGFTGNPSAGSLKKIEEKTGINPQKEWIKFIDSTEDMFALHRAADVYLSASRKDAFSYGILEAISQNVPVVVSDISGTSWSWKYTKCSKFKNGNINECAVALEKALETRFDQSNAEEVIKQYNIITWCKKIVQVYESILTK